MIILNSDQAAVVRGAGDDGSRLEPVPLTDGVTFVLHEAVLEDPAYESVRDLIAVLPTRTVRRSEYEPE